MGTIRKSKHKIGSLWDKSPVSQRKQTCVDTMLLFYLNAINIITMNVNLFFLDVTLFDIFY